MLEAVFMLCNCHITRERGGDGRKRKRERVKKQPERQTSRHACRQAGRQIDSNREEGGRKHWAFPQKPLRLIRDVEVGGLGILYLTPTRYTVTTRMILH